VCLIININICESYDEVENNKHISPETQHFVPVLIESHNLLILIYISGRKFVSIRNMKSFKNVNVELCYSNISYIPLYLLVAVRVTAIITINKIYTVGDNSMVIICFII